MRLKSVRNGWRLDSVLSVSVAPASFFSGKLPYFKASSDTVPGGWRGGDKWLAASTPLPWGLPGVV